MQVYSEFVHSVTSLSICFVSLSTCLPDVHAAQQAVASPPVKLVLITCYCYQYLSAQLMLIGPCSTTEDRDPVTSTPLIILGRRISLDIAQVVRWKSSPTAEVLHTVRCAASFAGYAITSWR